MNTQTTNSQPTSDKKLKYKDKKVNNFNKNKVTNNININDTNNVNNKVKVTDNNNSRLNFRELLFELKKLKKYQHSPKVDLHECNELYVINVELPGVLFEDIKIEILDDQVLLVSGHKQNKNNYYVTRTIYSECRYNNFMRRIKVPTIVDKNTLTKTISNGILSIQVKKEINKELKIDNLNEEKNINWADDVE